MMTGPAWVVLTQGTRPAAVRAAIDSIRANGVPSEIVVVENGGPTTEYGADVRVVRTGANLGVPGGRDVGIRETESRIVGFLDDDATLVASDFGASVAAAFDDDATLGALSFRIIDGAGSTQRRHVPRVGSGSADRSGPVATFLGGGCAIRRTAYEAAGGYWAELFYAHEELDLSWRLQDAGFDVRYVAELLVEHPHTPISRHADGWRLTGRNRVLIARRNLPWPVVPVHTLVWLVLGAFRAPDTRSRGAYVRGWWSGWRGPALRRPIRWGTVARLTRLGRPPVV